MPKLFANFASVTLKANEKIVSVFTYESGKLWHHLEFRDMNDKLLAKTRKKRWDTNSIILPIKETDLEKLQNIDATEC